MHVRARLPRAVPIWAPPLALALLIALHPHGTRGAGPAKPAAGDSPPNVDRLARAFGASPTMWRPHLSPDGERVVFLRQHRGDDVPVAMSLDFASGESKLLLASLDEEFDLLDCGWANESRILCAYLGAMFVPYNDAFYSTTRVVGVDADGSDMKALMQGRLRSSFAQYEHQILNWLPDEPEQVLILTEENFETGVGKLNVRSGRVSRVVRPKPRIDAYVADTQGRPRLRSFVYRGKSEWFHRSPDGRRWRSIWEGPWSSKVGFHPVGFGEDPSSLFALRRDEDRLKLFSEDIVEGGRPELVFEHDMVDVVGVEKLGPTGRVVGARFITDRIRSHYFDPSIRALEKTIRKSLPGKSVQIVDESRDRDVYLIFADGDADPGTWYRLDLAAGRMTRIAASRPVLRDVELSASTPFHRTGTDGKTMLGYVTRPSTGSPGPRPLVVMPQGLPWGEGAWAFDWLGQFLAARGFAVYQPSFRGTAGFGVLWMGESGFQGWREIVSDIDAGVDALIAEGVADPDRICAVGRRFGGYVALLTALEHPERYDCVVSIAGVTDLRLLLNRYRAGLTSRYVEEVFSLDPAVLDDGSPARRARDFRAAVLAIQPEEDVFVRKEQGRALRDAMRTSGKTIDYVEYAGEWHSMRKEANRIDMLTRVGAFLEKHLDDASREPGPVDAD